MQCNLQITTELFIRERSSFTITPEQIPDYIDELEKIYPFDLEGLIIIKANQQEAVMSDCDCIGFLWQSVLNSLDELLTENTAIFHCPAEVEIKHLKNPKGDTLLCTVEGAGQVEYDFKTFVFGLLDAAKNCFNLITNNLSYLTENQSDDNYAGSYDYSDAIEYSEKIRESYSKILYISDI